MKRLFYLLLVPASLLSQDIATRRARPAEPAVEFTTTSNASQVGASFVVGYRFTVQAPVVLNALGAVLQGQAKPIFGALPASMPVGLWDEAQNLLVSATVSAADPLVGHFNYAPVSNTLLTPGVTYTVGGLVAPGWSVLSDVPAMMSGSLIVYGGALSLASKTLAFPAGNAIAQRSNYFGPGFTYTGSASPVALSGQDRKVTAGEMVKLDGSDSFSAAGGAVQCAWKLVSAPRGSTAALSAADSATPSFVPDREGVYVAELIVSDGRAHSKPSTVSVAVTATGSR